MPNCKSVINTLVPVGERAESVEVAQGLKHTFPARQYLVRIRLMPHVPDYLVVRSVIDIMQSHSEFDDAESGGEMPRMLADNLNDVPPQLVTELR